MDANAGAGRQSVVVVGPGSSDRAAAARRFVEEGQFVMLCAGPPSCALLHQERCGLVDAADAVVFMPRRTPVIGRIDAGLARCARAAKCAVVLEGSAEVSWPDNAIKVAEDDLDGVALGLKERSV